MIDSWIAYIHDVFPKPGSYEAIAASAALALATIFALRSIFGGLAGRSDYCPDMSSGGYNLCDGGSDSGGDCGGD